MTTLPAASNETVVSVGERDGIQLGLSTTQVPYHLTGQHGIYRSDEVNALGPEFDNDFAVVNLWLKLAYERTHSDATLQNYRKEIVRLMRWAFRKDRPLSSLSMADASDYLNYMANPDPIDIGTKKVGLQHPDWRPFLGPLKGESIQTARNVLASFYSFCTQSLYMRINPFLKVNAVRQKQVNTVERVLSEQAVAWLFQEAESVPESPDRSHALDRWLVHCLFGLALRASETSTSCKAVRQKKTAEGESLWMIKVDGKGGKDRDLVMPKVTVLAMVAYREAHGLPSFPIPGKSDEPLVMGPSNRKPISRATLHNRLKAIFERAATRAEDAGDLTEAHELRQASAHWMRHTTATRLANDPNNAIHNVSKFLGHASIATTTRYVHSDIAAQAKMMGDYVPPVAK